MDNDYVDIDELEQDVAYKGTKSPQNIMEDKFNNIYKRDYKRYLESIEWDTWCKPYDPIEQARIQKEHERNVHPFKKFLL